MNREIVYARVAELVAMAESKFKISMGVVPVGFFSKGSAAGLASQRHNSVEFNEVLMERHPEDFDNTVIHEVSHLITHKVYPYAKQAHGPEFKRVMMIMGGEPNTYHSYDVSGLKRRNAVMKFEYSCGCAGFKHYVATKTHNKIEVGAKYRCAKCYTHIVFTGVSAKIKRVD